MGTDIHFHLEVLLECGEGDYHWQYYGEVNIPRDYSLFGFLSGVRGELPIGGPLANPGLPEGEISCTVLAHLKDSKGDYHTLGWLDEDGIVAMCRFLYSQSPYKSSPEYASCKYGSLFGTWLFDRGVKTFLEDRSHWPKWFRGARAILWYDS